MTNEERTLRAQRAGFLKTAREILDRPGDNLSHTDEREVQAAMAGADAAARQLRQGGATDVSFTSEKSISAIEAELRSTPGEPTIRPGAEYATSSDGDTAILRSGDKLADLPGNRNTEGLRFGAMIRCMAGAGRKEDAAEKRALAEGTIAGGGALVPAPVALQIIDKARNLSVLMNAGAKTVVMENATLALPRLTTDSVGQWVAENAVSSNSDMIFDRVLLTARSIAVLSRMSVELVEDTDISTVVEDAFAKALAVQIDYAGLLGAGTGAIPLGIRNQTGVPITVLSTNGKTLIDYSDFVNGVQVIRTANFEPNAAIYSPRTAGELNNLQNTLHDALDAPDDYTNLRKYVTNQIGNATTVGTGTTCSEAILGDFTQAIFGTRTSLVLEVSRTAADTVSSAMASRQVFVRGYARLDWQVAHPLAFNVLSGIL